MDQWNTEGSTFSWGFLQSNKWLGPAPAVPDGAAREHSSIAGYQQVSCWLAQACHCAGHVWSNCTLIASLLRTATGHSFTPQAVACETLSIQVGTIQSTQKLISSHDWPHPTVSGSYARFVFTSYGEVRQMLLLFFHERLQVKSCVFPMNCQRCSARAIVLTSPNCPC